LYVVADSALLCPQFCRTGYLEYIFTLTGIVYMMSAISCSSLKFLEMSDFYLEGQILGLYPKRALIRGSRGRDWVGCVENCELQSANFRFEKLWICYRQPCCS
jgi:hypothetical protein